MRLSKKFIIIAISVLLIYGIAIGGLFFKFYDDAKVFNETLRLSQTSEYSCYVDIHQRGGATDSWEKNTLFDSKGHTCTGMIYDADFINACGYDVSDWTLRVNIHQDSYLNNGWCGVYEVHQFDENGKEFIQTLDLRAYDVNELSLKYQMDGQDLLIPLKNGDYFIYYPNSEVNECPVYGAQKGTTSITFGFIMYYGYDGLDLSDNCISYHLHKPILTEAQELTFVTLLAVWVVFAIAFVTLLIYSVIMGRRMEKKEAAIRESLSVFSGFVDAKDPYTNGHSERVGKYTSLISEKLGMSKEQCTLNYYIGLMHDCGKCYIPDAILKKPARLTDEEYEIIKTHTIRGTELLEGFNAIEGIKEGARSHHERYDGKGYPDGLAGEDIPLIGRIICVADSFDAMNSKRYYRDRLRPEEILREMRLCSGTQFDPKIVDAFLELVNDHRIDDLY